MPRHVTHPRRDTLNAVYDRALARCSRADTGQGERPGIVAFDAVMRREDHRSGRGG